MKRLNVSVTTIDNQSANFNLKYLKSIYTNEIVVRVSYLEWLKTGRFDDKNYVLTPESLRDLVDLIANTKIKSKISTISSIAFLKSFSTSTEYMNYLKEINSLPILD